MSKTWPKVLTDHTLMPLMVQPQVNTPQQQKNTQNRVKDKNFKMDAKAEKLIYIKPVIRSILLSHGRRVTEKEFRKSYYETEGESFNEVLRTFESSFLKFVYSIPDTCRVYNYGGEVLIERVSAEGSAHMDSLTINTRKKKSKSSKLGGFRTSFGRPAFSYSTGSHQSVRPPGFLFRRITNSLPATPPPPSTSRPARPTASYPVTKSTISFKPGTSSKPTVSYKGPQPKRPDYSSLPLPLHMRLPPVVYKASEQKNAETPEQSKADEAKSNYVPLSVNDISAELSSSNWSSDEDLNDMTSTRDNGTLFKFVKSLPVNAPSNSFLSRTNKEVVKTDIKKEVVTRPVAEQKESSRVSLSPQRKSINESNSSASTTGLEGYLTQSFSVARPRLREIKCKIFRLVEILENNNPSQFILQFNQTELNHMTDEMNSHYQGDCKHLSIKKVYPGMTVAAKHGVNWRRAEVLCITEPEALLCFVDTNEKAYVPIRILRYLHESFGQQTRKSCRGSLFGVKPSNGERLWSVEATMAFMSKTKGMKIYASVKGQKEGCFEFVLSQDANGCEKVSSYMVEKGVAEDDSSADYSLNAILV